MADVTPLRLTVLTEIPAPFRIPLFNALADEDVETTVLFLRERNPLRPYALHAEEFRFAWRVLPGFHVTRGSRWLVLNAGVLRALRRTRPDVVLLGGWNQPAFWIALGGAKVMRRPVAAWVESTASDERKGSPLRDRAKRFFLRRCNGFIVPGRASQAYLEMLGIDREHIGLAPNSVDLAIFRDRVGELRSQRDALRQTLGVEGFSVLSVGRLDPEKGIDLLIRALPPDAHLLVAGVGSEETRLRALAEEHAPGRVRFLGFVARDELPQWYAVADAFALPSRSEQWGMALNEAAAAGLPLVASDAAGAAHELVEPGDFRIPAGDERALAEALGRLSTDAALRNRNGLLSQERAAALTPEAWAASTAALTRKILA